jgi:salicylate hydroxylase
VLTAAVTRADATGSGAALHLNARVAGVEPGESGPATVQLADGARLRADVVVGADGIHSAVRRAVADDTPATFSGDIAYRALVPTELLRRRPGSSLAAVRKVTVWVGPGRHLVHYLVRGGRLCNFVAVVPGGDWAVESWSAAGNREDLLASFAGWDRRVTSMLARIDTPHCWALHDREPLDRWVAGRTCLLGDACHPMLPYQAQGAAQAIEDAAALGRCLAAVAPDGVHEALVRYAGERQARAARVQAVSRGNRELFHLDDGARQRERDAQLAVASGAVEHLQWLYGGAAPRP